MVSLDSFNVNLRDQWRIILALFIFFKLVLFFSLVLALDVDKFRFRPTITLFVIRYLFLDNWISLYIFASHMILTISFRYTDFTFKLTFTYSLSLIIVVHFTLGSNYGLAFSFLCIDISFIFIVCISQNSIITGLFLCLLFLNASKRRTPWCFFK